MRLAMTPLVFMDTFRASTVAMTPLVFMDTFRPSSYLHMQCGFQCGTHRTPRTGPRTMMSAVMHLNKKQQCYGSMQENVSREFCTSEHLEHLLQCGGKSRTESRTTMSLQTRRGLNPALKPAEEWRLGRQDLEPGLTWCRSLTARKASASG